MTMEGSYNTSLDTLEMHGSLELDNNNKLVQATKNMLLTVFIT